VVSPVAVIITVIISAAVVFGIRKVFKKRREQTIV